MQPRWRYDTVLPVRRGEPVAERLRRQVYRFGATVAPATTVALVRALPGDCTIETIRVRLYAGAGLQMRVNAWLVPAVGPRYNLLGLVGKQHVDGDDDTWEWDIREPAYHWRGDSLLVEAQNLSATQPYDFAADIACDFAGGPYPVLRVVS